MKGARRFVWSISKVEALQRHPRATVDRAALANAACASFGSVHKATLPHEGHAPPPQGKATRGAMQSRHVGESPMPVTRRAKRRTLKGGVGRKDARQSNESSI